MKIERRTREEVNESVKVTGVTLLSVEEYKAAKEHIAMIADWWWLRSPSVSSDRAALVSSDGRVSAGGNYVDNTLAVVRPALLIQNLDSFNLKPSDKILDYAGYNWTVVSDTMVLCDAGIAEHCFREDWKVPDANDYEQSDVKKFLESWAAEKGIISCEKDGGE